MATPYRPRYRTQPGIVCLVKGHKWVGVYYRYKKKGIDKDTHKDIKGKSRYPFKCTRCRHFCWVLTGNGMPSGPFADRLDNGENYTRDD